MQHKKKVSLRGKSIIKSSKAVTFLVFVFLFSHISAQESLNSSGGDASGSGGTVCYSVGQVVQQTITGTNGSVAQGVQQPYEISVVTAIEEIIGIDLSVVAYPNPTADYLQLKVESEYSKKLSYQLYNMNGKLLQSKKLTGIETQIDMSNYVPSTYFVRVITEKQSIKEFKIIKK